MSAKSRKSSISKQLRKPFSKTVLAKARKLAAQYEIILSEEDGHYYGRGLELPHVMADGDTADACEKSFREAATAAVAYMLENSMKPPSPAREQLRTEQVNVRLTVEEKTILSSTAADKGFRSVSDYMRNAALAGTH